MFCKSMTYTDFNGIERTENFYFNLTKAELAELELTTEGGMKNRLTAIIDSKDQAEIVRNFKKIILLAYGEKSDDGRFFEKSDAIRNRFACTQAYSDLFMELSTNAEAASEFINLTIPPDLRESGNQ